MRWVVLFAVSAVAALVVLGAASCRDRLSEPACLQLRSEAFEIINGVHVCDDDSDCLPSNWPGCAKPLNTDHHLRLGRLETRFTEGHCREPEASCREPLEVYCDRSFCVFRQVASAGPSD